VLQPEQLIITQFSWEKSNVHKNIQITNSKYWHSEACHQFGDQAPMVQEGKWTQ